MNESLLKTFQFTKSLIKIIKVIFRVAIICLLILAGIFYFTDLSASYASSTSLTLGAIELVIKPDAVYFEDQIKIFIPLALILVSGLCAVIHQGLQLLEQMVDAAIASSPFQSSISKNLRKLSQLIILGGVLYNILQLVVVFRIYRTVDYTLLFNLNVVEQINFKFVSNISFIFTAGLVYLLSKIFEYGEELQTLSDETL